jgi:hypothetical protein
MKQSKKTGLNNMSDYDPNKCNQEVFDKGTSLGLFDLTKEEANEYCASMNASGDGNVYDWHYVGGRVHVKFFYLNNRIK